MLINNASIVLFCTLSLYLLIHLIFWLKAPVDTQEEAGKPGLRTGDGEDIQKHKSCFGRVCFCCAIFTTGDCREEDEANHEEDYGEEALFCTLCNAEVLYAEPQPYFMCIVCFCLSPISLYLTKSILLVLCF